MPTVKTDKGHEINSHYLKYTTILLEKQGKGEEMSHDCTFGRLV
nr:MAG TPA: hypothetical protein [Caudoviricetes sp.]